VGNECGGRVWAFNERRLLNFSPGAWARGKQVRATGVRRIGGAPDVPFSVNAPQG
jgi:hypothetical protein